MLNDTEIQLFLSLFQISHWTFMAFKQWKSWITVEVKKQN